MAQIFRFPLLSPEEKAWRDATLPRIPGMATVYAFPSGKIIRHGGVQIIAPAPAPAMPPRQADNEVAKANYIRRVKMLQRDCEKALPEFDDATYRAILQARYGEDSSKTLSTRQLHDLLLYMQGLLRDGGKATASTFDAPALLYDDASGMGRTRHMAKIRALLSEKGKTEGSYVRWDYALTIMQRQTRGLVDAWNKATPQHLRAVIAALSKDAKRKGRDTR